MLYDNLNQINGTLILLLSIVGHKGRHMNLLYVENSESDGIKLNLYVILSCDLSSMFCEL